MILSFNKLSKKTSLVNTKLATMDDAKNVFLNYVCPINQTLITRPIAVFVDGKVQPELYDIRSIERYLATKPLLRSPLSMLPINKIGIDDEINNLHKAYLLELDAAIKALLIKRESKPNLHLSK